MVVAGIRSIIQIIPIIPRTLVAIQADILDVTAAVVMEAAEAVIEL